MSNQTNNKWLNNNILPYPNIKLRVKYVSIFSENWN